MMIGTRTATRRRGVAPFLVCCFAILQLNKVSAEFVRTATGYTYWVPDDEGKDWSSVHDWKRKNRFVLAESTTGVRFIRRDNTRQRTQAGDYTVWNDSLWTWHPDENYAIATIGRARGQCTQVMDGFDAAGHCSWTFTLIDEGKDGTIEHHKLMITGDVASLAWTERQVLAIVGGTGMYAGATGTVHVTFRDNFFIHEIHLIDK